MLNLLQYFLKRTHPQALVFRAQTLMEATSLIEQHTFRVIISDYGLPDGNGDHLFQSSDVSGYKIGISGATDVTEFKRHCDYFMPKPFDLPEMDALLKKLLLPDEII
jgi:DNA-binding response OmpR family regulator